MKFFIGSVLWIAGLHLVSSATLVPHPDANLKTVNVSDNKLTTRGDDPSEAYQNLATVEIWSSVHAVNWGNARDGDIYNTVVEKLRELCPYNEHKDRDCPGSTYKKATKWTYWDTKALVDDNKVASIQAKLRIEEGKAFNGEVYELLLDLAASTLKAFVSEDHNCADVSGTSYCNVPDAVRINLPQTEWDHDKYSNHLHIETWDMKGKNSPLPWTHDRLYPCRTRQGVDKVMDSKQDRLEELFPEWKGKFHREAWVILNGWESCKDGTP